MSRPLLPTLALLLLAACSSAAAAPPSPSPSLTPPPTPTPPPPPEPVWRSPNQLLTSPDGRRLYVVDPTADAVAAFELPSGRHLGDVQVGRRPQQAALSPDGATLFVSCSFAARVDELDTAGLRLRRSLPVGNEPDGLLVSPDGRRLFVTSYLDDTLDVLELPTGRTLARIPVGRGPRFVARSPKGNRLVVSNGLGRSVTIVDPAALHALETRALGRASILRDVLVTPDGRFAIVAHVVSRDELVPTQLERGFIHANGFTVLALDRPGHFVTLLLDTMFDGAANPFGLAVTPDGRTLYVSILGTDEVAAVDLPRALQLVLEADDARASALSYDVGLLDRLGIARRLSSGGLGPRGITLARDGRTLFVANYFSEAVARLSLPTLAPEAPLRLAPERPRTPRREGERLFDTASITFERWFSCVSCHEEDAGIDALNWDLPNDGTGNPKNVKSLRDAYDTPPAMWTAVRKDMDAAVRAGQRFQGFLPHMEIHPALRAFLDTPERPPNPHRAADPALLARGRTLFTRARCDTCHPGPTFVDGRKHDLGLVRPTDPGPRFDTPSLRETYRTGPWLHDGRASTLESIFRAHDPAGLHGRAFELSDAELHELLAYVRSL